MKEWLKFFSLILIITSCAKKSPSDTSGDRVQEQAQDFKIIQSFDAILSPWGVWENVEDKIKVFKAELTQLEKIKGDALALDYDFRGSQDTTGGIWLDVSKYDFKKYHYLGFWIKGEPKLGYSRIVGVTLEDIRGKRVTKFFGKVKPAWIKVEISLEQPEIRELERVREVNIFIDRRYIDQKVGRIYLDEIYLR